MYPVEYIISLFFGDWVLLLYVLIILFSNSEQLIKLSLYFHLVIKLSNVVNLFCNILKGCLYLIDSSFYIFIVTLNHFF